MHNIHFNYAPVEYLAASLAENQNTGDEAVVLTLRNPDQWQPCNLGFTRPQAERLLQDLQRLLAATPLLLMLLVGTGCSARVDVSTERSSGGESAAHHTNVAVDVLTDQKETPTPSPEPEQPPATATTEKGVEVAGVANFAMVVEGDLHVHEHRHMHLHVEETPEPKRRKTKPERIKVEVHRPKIDPECERLRREYEEKVREWKALMNR